MALSSDRAAAAASSGEAARIDGGWCVQVLPGGHACIDGLEMMYNYRVVLSPRVHGDSGHPVSYTRGYCYFGHGHDESGQPRTMATALLAAIAAAQVWDGGEAGPPGFDKRAC